MTQKDLDWIRVLRLAFLGLTYDDGLGASWRLRINQN